ncbi:MAG: hypothetical protein AB7G28_18970 [Pirellulales bacterium]
MRYRNHASLGSALFLSAAIGLLLTSAALADVEPDQKIHRYKLPKTEPVELKLVAKLGPGPARENSGIVKSRQHGDLFWIENDSGDEPRIYPIHRDGKNYADTRYDDEQGVLIGGAINVDWEDITNNASGEIIVADVGNNENDRRDLVLYYLDEPSPIAGRTTFRKKVFIRYPDQEQFPPDREHFNFDCEAVFTVDNTLYFLSKNRGNSHTTLYRLDDEQPEVTNVLTKLGTADIQGQAVGADCTADGKRLAVLTYSGIWMFVRDSLDQDFFDGQVYWAPLKPRDAEAICFADDKTLLVADEAAAELYELAIDKLQRVQ